MKALSKLREIPQIFSSFLSGLISGGTAVGLSIGTSSIKLIELKRAGKVWKLVHCGMIQLPEDSIVNREIMNPVAVTESIRSLVAQVKLTNKTVCTAISGNALIVRRMMLEVPNPRELQEQVYWEAEQYLPFDIAEVVMDFQVLSDKKDPKTDILFVAAKKTVLDSYIKCIEDAGLKVKIMDVDFFALQNLFEINYPMNPAEAVVIVDIGASSMKIVVVNKGIPIFTKDTALGGNTITGEIQKNLSLSYIDAEALKIGVTQSETTPQAVKDLVQLMEENFATEIKKAIDFYNASSANIPIAYVLLTGGSSRLPGLSEKIEQMVNLPTQNMNSFNSISCDPATFSQEYLSDVGSFSAVPLGLALRAGLS